MKITAKQNVVVVRRGKKIIQRCESKGEFVKLFDCVKCWIKAKLKR